jgi:hypothetical protein
VALVLDAHDDLAGLDGDVERDDADGAAGVRVQDGVGHRFGDRELHAAHDVLGRPGAARDVGHRVTRDRHAVRRARQPEDERLPEAGAGVELVGHAHRWLPRARRR